MLVNDAGRKLIMDFEALRLEAYRCPAGRLTIGYGHTGDVRSGDKIDAHQAEAILSVDLDTFERAVSALTADVDVNENQFSALVSLAFNIGTEALRRSRLLMLLNEGRPAAAVGEFAKWCHAGGKVLPGLERRRAAEQALFQKPVIRA